MDKKAWTPVENSSLVSGYRYHPEEQCLDVLFKSNGAKYRYGSVGINLYEEMVASEKIGSFIKKNIINGKHNYSKIS